MSPIPGDLAALERARVLCREFNRRWRTPPLGPEVSRVVSRVEAIDAQQTFAQVRQALGETMFTSEIGRDYAADAAGPAYEPKGDDL